MKAFLVGQIAALGIAVTAAFLFPGLARSEPVYVLNCSGTYIGGGYVLTAGHCTTQDNIFVSKDNPEMEDHTNVERFSAKVVWGTQSRDFGLIQLDKALVKRDKNEREDEPDKGKFKEQAIKDIPFKASTVSCVTPRVGEHVTTQGFPAGEYIEAPGVVVSVPRKIGPWQVAQWIAIPGWPGSSGSGVLNDRGEVVAVIVGLIRGSGLMIAVPTSEVCNILPRDIK